MEYCGLYIHIPFCKKKCYYCDFPSYCNLENLIKPYIAALKKEIQLVSVKYPDIKIKTIFIGGGTPTYINYKYIIEIIELIKYCFEIKNNAEISIEGNPGTFDLNKLLEYRKVGINRLSIGLQAWQDNLLKKLGRIHTQKQFKQAMDNAKVAGFENINIDLIFGLPEQCIEDWKETLEKVTLLQPTHLSCYSLKIEEETPFYALYKQGKLQIDEDLEREMYYYTKKFLNSKGYHHYEISNFAKTDFECIHNGIYWDVKPYIGLGSSAHSFINNHRYSNTNTVSRYIKELSEDRLPIKNINKINQEQLMQEYMFLGMRKIDGVSSKEFNKIFGKDIDFVYWNVLRELQEKGLIEKGEKIYLTSKGLDFANHVFQSFL
jgi:oxygen-independent coproporphyrinogen-3 oxidase